MEVRVWGAHIPALRRRSEFACAVGCVLGLNSNKLYLPNCFSLVPWCAREHCDR